MAWRAWNLGAQQRDPYLWSLVHGLRWDGPVVRADVVPTRANTNGIYALRALEGVPFGHVWGEVALSGVVVEGDLGYRAEVATIRSLYVGREQRALEPDGYHAGHTFEEWPNAALCAALEARYKVDVVVAPPRAMLPSPTQIFAPPLYQQVGAPIIVPQGVQIIGTAQTTTPFNGTFGGLGNSAINNI